MEIALRCYVDTQTNKKQSREIDNYSRSVVLVLDTETTTDEYQNLKFGSCIISINGELGKVILFYNEELKENEINTLKSYAKRHQYQLMSRTDFVENVFFPYVYKSRAQFVGFNLPFDLSRIAVGFTNSRKYKDGFSLKLSAKPWYPNIVIKTLDSKRSFIGLTTPLRKNSDKKRPSYKGYFLDLKTLLFALTNKSYSLKEALKDFQCKRQKIDAGEHGKINEEYIDYNINDTLATFELYKKALERYNLYGLDKNPNRLYSPASIGKAYLEKIGVKPFLEKNPEFPKEILGHLMNAYYGGRTEVKIRKEPVQVSYLDFTSMYPSLYVLLCLDKYLKADKIKCVNNTLEIQQLLKNITMDDLKNKDVWKKLPCICRLKPDNGILPVRANYGDSNTFNIGINIVKSDNDLWYSLPDLIASKFLSSKTPIIDDAISFVPEGIQDGLKPISIVDGITLNPDEDFIKKLIEERIRLKKEMKTKAGEERRQLYLKQTILKIIANSTSYGVFIEVNTSYIEDSSVNVYGLEQFKANVNKAETQGRAFNPIMAVTITAGSRLILATAEALIKNNNGLFAYCDTDSIFISPEHVKLLQDFFKSLNPYNVKDLEMFKVEDDDEGKPLNSVLFYGISAKRYVLYDYDHETREITIRKHSSHGLGHLLAIDEKQVWKDLLTIHYNPELKEEIEEKYSDKVAVSQLTISKYAIWERFKVLNRGKPLKKQIKPFNFITVGTGYKLNEETGKNIIPMMPFTSPIDHRFKEIPYMPFIDYRNGKYYNDENTLDLQSYWKPLTEVFFGRNGYVNHSESKSEGDIGQLDRKTITIAKGSIIHIGKETNELEESQILGVDKGNYVIYQDIKQIILNLTIEEAKVRGISKRNLYYLKEKSLSGDLSKIKSSTLGKLIT